MPGLQMHQLRVGAVARLICESFPERLDSQNVISACLLHDMGNIIKSDLITFPEFLEPQGLEYWRKVKDDFIQKYGSDDHEATWAIAKELSIPEKAFSYLGTIGFRSLQKVLESDSFERKICSYSDMRVGPHGVLPLEERLAEAHKRYAGKKHAIASDQFNTLANAVREIEKQIFRKVRIKPEDINDESVRQAIMDLRSMPMS